MSKIFIDTNLLVYTVDHHDPKKQKRCRSVLKTAVEDYTAVISTQVMGEFYYAAVKKLKADPIIIKNVLHSFEHFEVMMTTPEFIYDAIDCSVVNQLNFWNALIIVTAAHAHCQQLWTEDLQAGRIIHGVEIYHPLG